MRVLGLDTSNYTTSCAVFDGAGGVNRGRILDVRPGELGLRQSDALFQHVKRLPELLSALAEETSLEALGAVGQAPARGRWRAPICHASWRELPRAEPCPCAGRPILCLFSPAGASGRGGLVRRTDGPAGPPFLAWHLSGGTTELLRAEPEEDGVAVRAEILGGTTDISAGQLIDRTGVLLGLQFPAGKSLDALSGEADASMKYRVKRDGLRFSLSGMENQVKKLLADGEKPANIARFAIDTVTDVILRTTRAAQEAYPGLPVLCSGGVASNRRLRGALEEGCGAVFAQPQYAADNAMGTAILTWRALEREAGR